MRTREQSAADKPSEALPFTYRTLGLTLRSAFSLDELSPGAPGDTPGITIDKGTVPDVWGPDAPHLFVKLSEERQLLRWAPVGAFLIAGDDAIIVDPLPNTDPRLVALPLLGPVVALLLHRRGRLVLHASAVEVGGRAVVLLGDKGAGKSTLAGALVAGGHRLLTDDVAVISQPPGGVPHVEAAAGQMKLFDESRAALTFPGHVTETDLYPGLPKRQHRLNMGFRTDPAPLGFVFALGRGPMLAIEPLTGGDALQALIRFSYVARFGRDGIGESGMRRLFQQCATASQAVSIGHLIAPLGLDRLNETVRAIEALASARPAGDR